MLKVFISKVVEEFDIGKPAEDLYKLFENKKDKAFEAICEVKDRARKIELLTHALDENQSLGKLFYIQRGKNKPLINKGTLKLINAELEKEKKLLEDEKRMGEAKESPPISWGMLAFWKKGPAVPVVQKLNIEEDEKNASQVSSGIGFQDQL